MQRIHGLFLCLVLIGVPSVCAAQLPLEDIFMRAAPRFGIQPETQHHIIHLAETLRYDTVVACSIVSVYPPQFHVSFASGTSIDADGYRLRIARYDYDDDFDDDDLPFEDYAGLCIAVFLGGFLLLWIGFFGMWLQLAVTGAELIFFALMLCL
ncbi:MAG: hypothetical protein N3B18_05170 [Desulfobacterota bacterium]|nr:hypothetical protein [Thermodesulfobacteriota bacterium]